MDFDIKLLVGIWLAILEINCQVNWILDTTIEPDHEPLFGKNVRLNCTATGCCASVRQWSVEISGTYTVVLQDGTSSNLAKYEEDLQASANQFNLVIKDFQESDLKSYRCSYLFSEDAHILQMSGGLHYLPSESDIAEVVKDFSSSTNAFSYTLNITSVYPDPSCTASYGGDDLTSSMTKTLADNGNFKSVLLQFSNVAHSCSGIFIIQCTVGSYTNQQFANFEPCQSTDDSCDWSYWICIVIIWLVDSLVSGVCTAVLVKKKKKAKNILCWFADHIFICCGPWIKTFCEANASTRYRGTPKLLLVAVLQIGIIASVVVWIVLMIIVFCTFCACVKVSDIILVAFLSLLLSLLAVLLWTAIVLAFCKDGYTHISPSGGTVKLFNKILNPDLKTKSITYTHDGHVVSPANVVCEGGTRECPWLTLRNVSLDQTGEYVCTINYGPSQQEVHKQDILVTPKQNEVQVGDKIVLLSFLKDLKKNDNIETIEWTHNANVIQTNKFCYKGGNINNPPLTIKFCSASDSGLYVCTVKTKQSLNPKMFSAQLKIKDEIKVDVGGTTILLQNLNMKNIRDVQWYHEQKPIPYELRYFDNVENRICPALTISLVTACMAGKYQCIVKYSKDEDTKVFEVRVKVIEQYTVDCGDCINLMNDLSSHHGIKNISWELNGNHLELAENPSYIGGTKDCPVLTIYCATKTEAGKYKCVLTLESQPIKEFNIKLVVNEQLRVDSGERSVLLDKLKKSDNVVSVAWTHKKMPVRYPHKGGTNECPALTIPVVSLEDSGEYECKITLKQGHVRLYRLVVNVNVQKIKKKVGDEVTLLQNLKSAGTIKEIDWYKNGEKVRAGKDKKYKGGINQSPGLSVGSLKKHDSGLYKCDLIVKESEIKLHILVDLTVEQEENSTSLGPISRQNGVRNHDNSAENNQSLTEEEQQIN